MQKKKIANLMAQIPPKWVMEKYAKLWTQFRDTPFTAADAKDIMSDIANPSVFYTKLRTTGWLTQEVDPQDGRKRINKLKDPREMIEEIGNNRTTGQQRTGQFPATFKKHRPKNRSP